MMLDHQSPLSKGMRLCYWIWWSILNGHHWWVKYWCWWINQNGAILPARSALNWPNFWCASKALPSQPPSTSPRARCSCPGVADLIALGLQKRDPRSGLDFPLGFYLSYYSWTTSTSFQLFDENPAGSTLVPPLRRWESWMPGAESLNSSLAHRKTMQNSEENMQKLRRFLWFFPRRQWQWQWIPHHPTAYHIPPITQLPQSHSSH